MTVYAYTNFSKRENSTKVPANTPGSYASLTVVWKENTSVENPSILLTRQVNANYTYFYIVDWKMYYFVTDIVQVTYATYQFDLKLDVLASFKTNIGSTIAHIAYSSTGFDKNIVDPRIAIKATYTKYTQPEGSGFDSDGCYIIGIINDKSNGKVGAVSYYIIDTANLTDLMVHLTGPDFISELTQFFTSDWLDLIPSCIWIPVSIPAARNLFGQGILVPGHALTVGSSDAAYTHTTFNDVLVYDVTTPIAEVSNVSLNIPYKWQDFRDCQPYTSASIYLPGIGETDLNINEFYESTKVSVITNLDATTGDIMYRIFDDDGIIMKTVMFNGGVQVALAHITTNSVGSLASVGGVASGLVGAAASAATANPVGLVGSGIGILAAASTGIMNANHRSTSIKGTNTGRSSFKVVTFTLTLVCHDTEDCDDLNYIARFGRPVALTQAISNHSGYVQCENASVASTNFMSLSAQKEINGFLNSGFYYE